MSLKIPIAATISDITPRCGTRDGTTAAPPSRYCHTKQDPTTIDEKEQTCATIPNTRDEMRQKEVTQRTMRVNTDMG